MALTVKRAQPLGNAWSPHDMVFNSFIFVAFFVAVYGLYLILPHRWQNRMLLVASYVFYGWWDWRFLGLIVLSTVVDYVAGLGIASSKDDRVRRRFLIASMCTNLGVLGLFKYANFFLHSLLDGLAMFGLELDARITSIVLPVGISFYTFQTMSYTIDIYRREFAPTRNFLDFALFVSFFPQLVAGPIERARVLLPQLIAPRRLCRKRIEEGCWLILSGYYLKCVLADNLAPFVETIFQAPESAHGFEVLVGVWAAAFQIYGDFSGYSRIAIGLSKLMGIDLMQNFNRPYFAVSPNDFWRRWHISLSTWLRDYLYIPLGGNRGTTMATYRNLMVTMLLGGLWHGAAWNFVAWGLFHGSILCIWRPISERRKSAPYEAVGTSSVRVFLRTFAFFQLTCVGWLLFFVTDLGHVPLLIRNCITQWQWNGGVAAMTILVFAVPVMWMELLGERSRQDHAVFAWSARRRLFVYCLTTALIFLCGAVEQHEFIYFQF